MKQSKVAKIADVSRQYLNQVLRGKRKPSTKLMPYLHLLDSDKPIYSVEPRDRVELAEYLPPPIIYGSTVILADMQIPFQDGDFILKVLTLAQRWGIKQGVSSGDFFNQAAFALFSAPPKDTIWAEEENKAADICVALYKFVSDWTMLLGNHDAFLLKKVAHQLNHESLLKLIGSPKGFKATNYYWCIIKDEKGREWRVTHPRNISVIHGRVPTKLAIKYKQNIISAHGHLCGMSPDDSGEYITIDIGICCDPDRLDYSQMRDSTRPKMNQGAVILKEVDGRIYPYHLSPLWTDWEAMGKLY